MIVKCFWRRYCTKSEFNHLGLDTILCKRLSRLGIVTPTDIQQKSLHHLLNGHHVIANAETGSGKTLCFLLPVLQQLLSHSRIGLNISSPFAAVLVPTPDLAHQVDLSFKELASDQFKSSMAYSNRRLSITPATHLIITTPTMLCQYEIYKILRNVKILCFDEADVLFVGGQRQYSWDVLKAFQKLSFEERKSHLKDNSVNHKSHNTIHDKPLSDAINIFTRPFRQLIFTAATLPKKGPKSVGMLLSRHVPRSTLFINTEQTHRLILKTDVSYVNINCTTSSEDLFDLKINQLIDDLNNLIEPVSRTLPKVLIFCNSVATVQSVYMKLSHINSWWSERAAEIHKMVPPEDRISLIHQYNTGNINVLISTDLASRGLDLVDVTFVIMFDFPVNTIDFLHRAGRTARAGKSGHVRAYVCLTDNDLAIEIQKATKDFPAGLHSLFSRNKMFRRKLKRKKNNIDRSVTQ